MALTTSLALLTLLAWLPSACQEAEGSQELRPLGTRTEPESGRYRAWLDCPGGEIAFELDLEKDANSGAWRGWYHNGPEKEAIGSVTMEGGHLVMRFDPYDSYIRARLSKRSTSLHGDWIRDLGGGRKTTLPFHAHLGDHPRYQVVHRRGLNNPIKRRYKVQFSEDKHHAVGLFQVDTDSRRVEATFLTTLGDYRYLSGVQDGSNITLSAFDGAHAFLFKARIDREDRLSGDFWSRDVWHETWTGTPDPDVSLPDPFGLTRFVGGMPLEQLVFPDVTGKRRTLADPAFAGKGRLIVLMGTWCPNCNDHTKYMVELHERYGSKGLSILGLAFEFGEDTQRHTRVVSEYLRHHKVPYPVLVAGPHNKEKAAKIFPLLDKVMAYPTTLFLDAKGNVQAVYTGFSGPATGAHHEKLRQAFERRIDDLLAQAE